jgi:hypothetical protein
MTKAETILKNYKPTIHVGQRVRFGSPWNRHEGMVIEDRGLLGGEGRQIIRVRYMEDYGGDGRLEPVETEIRAEEAEVINELAIV